MNILRGQWGLQLIKAMARAKERGGDSFSSAEVTNETAVGANGRTLQVRIGSRTTGGLQAPGGESYATGTRVLIRRSGKMGQEATIAGLVAPNRQANEPAAYSSRDVTGENLI